MTPFQQKRVVFDTNALFRFPVRALIEHLNDVGAFIPFWSQRTTEELQAVLKARGKPDADAFLSRFEAQAVATPGNLSHQGFRDAGDLHVVEAACMVQAQGIITDNARDFPLRHLRKLSLTRWSVDAFFESYASALDPAFDPKALRHVGLTRTARALSSRAANRE